MKYARFITRIFALMVGSKALISYLDPGSGSLIVQVLIAIIVGILATFRIWKARFLSLFGLEHQEEDEDENENVEKEN